MGASFPNVGLGIFSMCVARKYRNSGNPNERPTNSVAGMNTHRCFMFNRLPSKNTNVKNTSAEIRRSVATEDATLFAKMDEKNKKIVGCGSPKKPIRKSQGITMPMIHSKR